MANRKKSKEEVTPKSKSENVTSNIEENKEENPQVETSIVENFAEKAAESLQQELKEASELEELSQLQSDQEETPEQELEREEQKPKLHVLADDRLNSLINRANELGITDVIQILNSDKFGQFYLVYRD